MKTFIKIALNLAGFEISFISILILGGLIFKLSSEEMLSNPLLLGLILSISILTGIILTFLGGKDEESY